MGRNDYFTPVVQIALSLDGSVELGSEVSFAYRDFCR